MQSLNDTKREISVYGEGKVSDEVLAKSIITIKKAFPKLPLGWYDIMSQMIVEEGFTDARLIDAVKNLIKTCQYPEPTIAQILGFNKTKKIFTHKEILDQTVDMSPETAKRYWAKFDFIGGGRFVEK